MANAALFASLHHFKAGEFRRPDLMDGDFLRWLDLARAAAGVPFIVTSDARTVAENATVGGWERSLHLRGRAVDLRWPKKRADFFELLAGIFVTAGMAPGAIQLELETTDGNEHIHVGVFPPGEGGNEFFIHEEVS